LIKFVGTKKICGNFLTAQNSEEHDASDYAHNNNFYKCTKQLFKISNGNL